MQHDVPFNHQRVSSASIMQHVHPHTHWREGRRQQETGMSRGPIQPKQGRQRLGESTLAWKRTAISETERSLEQCQEGVEGWRRDGWSKEKRNSQYLCSRSPGPGDTQPCPLKTLYPIKEAQSESLAVPPDGKDRSFKVCGSPD